MGGRGRWVRRARRAGAQGGVLAALAGAIFLGACPEAKPVPFKHEDTPPDEDVPGTTEDPPPSDALTPAEAEARTHQGGPVLKLEGHAIDLPGARASLTLHLDGDSYPDALIWAGDEESGFALWRSLGSEDGFEAPRKIDRSGLTLEGTSKPCEVDSAAFSPLQGAKAALRVRLDCPAEQLEAPREILWVVGLASTPRVLERFSLRVGEHEAPLELADVNARDVDGDGHGDVQLVLRSSAAAFDIPLTWLDRPSGLTRDTREPEASLATLASRADKQLAEGQPEAAAASAARVIEVHGQLCREGESPQLGVADSWGLRCGDSTALARAALVAIRARAAEGDVLGAFEALQSLDREGAKVDPRARTAALEALAKAAETPDYGLAPVAALSLPAQAALPPRVRLLDDDVLWAGSEPPRIWSAQTREELPRLDAPLLPTSFSDPSGRYHVRHIDRDCDGRLLRLRSDAGQTVRARIRREPQGESCALRLPVPDAGDLRVLGWAPQGVVLADRKGALLVPLDARARPTEAPRRLPLSTPLPAPLPAGRAAPAGQCYVLPTPHGLLLRHHGREASEQFIRPPGWESLEGTVHEAAVDARCERLAIATSSHIYLVLPAEGASGEASGTVGDDSPE